MATPYLQMGLRLRHRPVTTTGVDFITASLRYNDRLVAAWGERTGSTPFTGGYVITTPLTTGYVNAKAPGLDDPTNLIEFPSGSRDGTVARGPRQTIAYTFVRMTESELQQFRLFHLMIPGSSEVVELVDENSNTIPVRWMGGFRPTPWDSSHVSAPWGLNMQLSVEPTGQVNTFTSGGDLSY